MWRFKGPLVEFNNLKGNLGPPGWQTAKIQVVGEEYITGNGLCVGGRAGAHSEKALHHPTRSGVHSKCTQTIKGF